MASTYIYNTISPGGVKFTYSVWFKLAKDSGDSGLVSTNPGGSQYWDLWVNPVVKFKCYESSSLIGQLVTNAKLRDVGAWYNIVVNIDFANVTEDQRMKLWINGVQQTGSMLSAETYPSTSGTVYSGSSLFNIGRYQASSDYFKGCMSHIHFYDGYAYDATDFGSFDSTSGIWKIKTSGPSTTYGTYGFNLKMEDRTNLDLDSSSNALSFTTGGTLTPTYDNPSNNFCTWNSLENYYGANTFTSGNTVITQNASYKTYNVGTLGMAVKGKYYWESMVTTDSNSNFVAGIQGKQSVATADYPADHTNSSMIDGAGGIFANGVDTGDYGSGYTTSSILSVAYDALNNFVYYGKDGTWLNSGDPTSGASGTGGFDPGDAAIDTDLGAYFPCWGANFTFVGGTKTNFGNGYFGTTAITSAGTNASENGEFEYDVPTGYTALCTKGINSF